MKEFWAQFDRYVRSYLPDWQYQRDGGEPEAALMTVLGEMLEESGRRLEGLPEKHQREYLSPWYDGPQGSEPMYVYAGLTSPQSVCLPRGTLFYCSGDGARLWETTAEAWAESGRLCGQLVSSGSCGKLLALPSPTDQAPTPLFDFRPPGVQRREVRFRHPSAFSSQSGCQISLRLLPPSDGLLRFLCDPACASWYLETEECAVPLEPPALADHTLRFRLPSSGKGAASLLVKAADAAVPPAVSIQKAVVEAGRAAASPPQFLTDSGLFEGEECLPFGPRLIPWSTCYLSCPDVLGLPGAEVTLSWRQSYRQREELLPGMDREAEYRPVMRRMPQAPPPIRDVRADGVLWEYWDGAAWRTIPGTESHTQIFSDADGDQDVRQETTFLWPPDARPCMVQGISAHWLRWRLSACEGAGWLPARYHAPVLSHVSLTAAFSGETALEQCCGVAETFQPLTGASKLLFPSITPEQDCWWLGFDAPPGGSLFCLYLSLRGRAPGGRLAAYEEIPGGGERLLSLQDGTDGLSHSGMLTLSGLQGRKSSKFGAECWWLCLREETGIFQGRGRKPVLEGLRCGAVLLRALQGDRCAAGERFSPLHGGPVTGTALSDCFGGVPEESDEEILRRLQLERHHLRRIVSAADAEQLICTSVRGAAQVRCVRSGASLQIGVLMRDTAHHAAAFQLRKAAIEQLITDRSALPSTGLLPVIREPAFYPIHVMVWTKLQAGAELSEVRQRITLALNRFLDPVTGNFGGTGWRMGELPVPAQLRACLQAAVPEASLTELVASAATPEGTERTPVSIHDPFALPLGGTYTVYTI